MSDIKRTGKPTLQPLTGEALAAHRASFRTQLECRVFYGLDATALKQVEQGRRPIPVTLELLYQLATHYPECVCRSVTIVELTDLLARNGVLTAERIAWFLGRTRSSVFEYRRGKAPPQLTQSLMTHLVHCLEHRPFHEVEAVVADAYAHPVPGRRLLALQSTQNRTKMQAILGIERPRFYALSKQEQVPKTAAIFIRLLEAFPELAPLSPNQTVDAFTTVMRQHGVMTGDAISRYLGLVRQAMGRYWRGDMQPSPTVLSLMQFIMRFLETHPLTEYEVIVDAVSAFRASAHD
jgi:hypothetical protein